MTLYFKTSFYSAKNLNMKQKKLVSTEFRLLTYGENLKQNWCFEWFDKNGKRCKKYGHINRFKSIEERYTEAAKLKVTLETGLIKKPKPAQSIIYQHLEPYLANHCETLRAASLKAYRTVLTHFDRWLIKAGYKQLHPQKLTKNEVDAYCRSLLIEQKMANATYNRYINVLDLLFEYLVAHDVLAKSPFYAVKAKPKNSTSVSAFKEQDVLLLKELLKKTNTTVYISCMVDMYAFIRPNEIRNLRLKDIDLTEKRIYIDKSFSKNKKSQYVVILPALLDILSEYIGSSKEKDFFLLSKSGRPGLVQISNKYVVKNHNRILQKQGYDISKFKPYSWKHTGNSLAYKNGASLRFLKSQNRHHSEAMTEIYLKSIVPEDLVSGQEQFFNF